MNNEEILVAICRWNAELLDARSLGKRVRIWAVIFALEDMAG